MQTRTLKSAVARSGEINILSHRTLPQQLVHLQDAEFLSPISPKGMPRTSKHEDMILSGQSGLLA